MVTTRTASSTLKIPPFCPHSVFMCSVWIWEQTAIISLYSIKCLVFITWRVFTARYGLGLYIQFYVLPTHCIYVFCVDLRTNSDYFPIQHWLVFITGGECLLRGMDWVFIYNSTFCPHSVFVCFVWIWEQTAIISLYNINWLVFITWRVFTARYGLGLYIQFYVLPTQCIYLFCMDLRTNSDYFPIQHWLTGLYNRDGVCLLRGTEWIFIYISC